MLKSERKKSIVAVGLTMSFLLAMICTSITVLKADPPSKIEEKLMGITQEEKQILQSLFKLSQEIELMENQEEQIAKEIERVNGEIKRMEAEIKKEEAYFTRQQEALKGVLRLYQKMGPGSYLEIILDSEDLSMMLKRLTTLRDLTRNTGKLMEALESSKIKLAAEKQRLAQSLEELAQKQVQSKAALQNKLKLKKEQEEYLASLKTESQYYREQLENIQKMLDEIKPMLADAAKEFSNIITGGNLSADSLKISFYLFNVKGTLDEKTFNDIVSKQPTLSHMLFQFKKDKIAISIPEKKLMLEGTFIIQEDNILRFRAKEGSFYGMPLEQGYVQELLNQGELALDLKPLLGSNTLKAIYLQDGYMELIIRPDLF